MDHSRFQFTGFKIVRSLIERNDLVPSKTISIQFDPKGIVYKENSNFQLHLGVKIEDKNKVINIDVQAIGNYMFEKSIELDQIDNFFFVNAPALLFPYIRAYISTLTNLSGFEPINLPTLNMIKLGEDLKKNTSEV